jgi:hypothetical protein
VLVSDSKLEQLLVVFTLDVPATAPSKVVVQVQVLLQDANENAAAHTNIPIISLFIIFNFSKYNKLFVFAISVIHDFCICFCIVIINRIDLIFLFICHYLLQLLPKPNTG